MSEAAVDSFRLEDEASDIVPFSVKSTDSFSEETGSLQTANTALKTSSTLGLNSSHESKPSFERWCVDTYAEFHTPICIYYYLSLSIVDYICTVIQTSKTFIQKSKALFPWSLFYRSKSANGNLLSSVRPLQCKQNLQPPVRTVLRSQSNDSPLMMPKKLSTNSHPHTKSPRSVIPQTFHQQRPSDVARPELTGVQKFIAKIKNTEPSLKDPEHRFLSRVKGLGSQFFDSLRSTKSSSAFVQKSRTTPQSFELQRFSAVQRLEIMHHQTGNTKTSIKGAGSPNSVPIVHIRRTTAVVEDYISVGSASFPQLRRNLQQQNGRKSLSEKATKKHGATTGEKVSSSKQWWKTDLPGKEKHSQASTNETRSHDQKKVVLKQGTSKNCPKMGGKGSSSKQCQETHSRREEKGHRSSNVKSRNPDGKKAASEQATAKHGATPGKKATSNKQRKNVEPRKKA